MFVVMRYGFVVVWTIFVIVMSLLPKSSIDVGNIHFFKGFDKIVHLFFYAILMFLWIKDFKLFEKSDNKAKKFIFGIFYCISLGVILEICQKYLEIGRSFDTFDIIANISGAIIVAVFLNHKIFKNEF